MNHKINQVLAAVLLVVALLTGQNAWAESSWTVTNSNGNSNTFTIKRSEKGYEQTVHFRTVSLSAYAGQHFTAVDMDYTFPANEDEKTVTVSELTPSGSYKYQNGTTNRKYRFEVTDRAGFILASADRTMTNGTSFSADKVSQSITNLVYFNGTSYASSLSSSKYVDVSYTPPTSQVETSGTLNGYVLIDDSYDYAQKPATVSTSDLINTTGANATYLNNLGYKIYATVCFTEKEKDDGYQYIQIIGGNGSASYDTGADPNGSVNAPVNSVYKTCFELSDGSNAEGKQYFPHRYSYANKTAETSANIGITEFSQTNGKLWQQAFKSGYQATNSGSLIFDASTSYITTRFDAGGDNDDTWGYKDLFVRMALVDASAPTKSAVSVNPGRHAKGNTVYVSVAFSEIVTVTGSPTLTTTSDNHWGSLTYVDGSGTNVLTFSTTIPQNATGDLNITGFSGTIQDLAGNSLSGGVTASSICPLDADFAYIIDDFQKDGDNYLIKTHEDLIGLAGYVNGGGATTGKTFLQVADITFAHTTDWNNSASTENNYTAIGYYMASYDQKNFEGTYDGGGHTISGIRIYRNNNTDSDNYQGLFGHVKSNGAIRNVNLSDTRITGRSTVGGIVGYNMGTVEDCTVAANVCIHQIYGGSIHGGVVGYNLGSVKRCISSAHLTVKNGISTSGYGGIVGRNEKSITDCIATDVVIPDVNARGAIVGVLYYNGPLTRNYYHGCKVASDNVTPSGVGQGTANSKTTSDETGAQPLWAVTLPNHASVMRTGTALPGTDNATYDNGADINGVPYAKGLSVVNLSYDPATITEGYDVLLSVNRTVNGNAVTFTDNDDHTYTIASMPTADITVSVTEIPIIAYIDADGNPQSHACTPIVEGTTSYQTLGRTEGWYVVNSDVTISGTQGVKFLDQQVNIILCDGTTLTSNATTTGYDGIEVKNGSLAIYGQSLGTGSIVATASNYSAISSKTSINLNGGIISGITNSGYAAITNDSSGGGSITIRRGNVTATGSTFGIRDLGKSSGIVILGGTVNATAHSTSGIGLYSAYRDISILGGNVTATVIQAGGYDATGTITLGYTTVDDRITASSYACAALTIADGQILSDGTDTYSGTLSSEQKTAIAGKTLSAAIPYIDADGTTKYKASKDLTFITTSKRTYVNAANSEGWYCVNSDVNFTDIVTFNDQQVNIILCDGATMSCEKYSNYDLISAKYGSLAIYGQTHGTGTLSLNCTASGYAIFANTNIDINGGVINAKSTNSYGICATNGNITIRRGNITARSTNAYGIRATTITLGCATTADRIYATSYNGTVVVADGQTLTDGYSANTYANTLTDEQKNAIKKKTMMKALGDVSYIDENGQEQICNNYKILSDGIYDSVSKIGESSKNTWYVASGNYTFNASYLQTYGHVHIILCDGASFTVNGSGSYGIYATDNLSIYGQSQDTGTLTVNVANASGKALYVDYGNLVVNGGVVSAHGGEYGIYIDKGKLTVNGGSINATGTTSGIYVAGNLTLGWNKLSDRITANSYSCTGTISVKEGQQLHNGSSLLSGTLYNHNGGNPTGDLSVLAGLTLKPAVPYIAADGTTQYCGEYTVLESSNEQFADYGTYGQENWYVVSGNVTFDGQLRFNDSHSHLIVCDGAHLTASAPVANEEAIYGHNGGITIYGQTLGTGTITANGASNGCGICSVSNITINGGTIIATGMYGFYSTLVGIIINRGTVTVTGTDTGIHADGNNVTINGGIVNATGGNVGIYVGETITLGWTNATDRIYANSYSKNPVVKSGQTLTDGTNAYSGSVNKSNIAGMTLQPATALAMNSAGIMTYASPYALDLNNVNAYVVSSYSNTNSTLTLTKVTEAPANTGLLLKAKEDSQKGTTVALPLKASAEAIASNLLVGVLSSETVVPQTYGDYTNFILANGKYGIDWYTLSEAGAIGANKAYLQLLTADLTNLAREFTWVYEGETTGIEPPTISPEGESTEAWYDLNGRKLNGKPTTKGLYIHNGRKVVVK